LTQYSLGPPPIQVAETPDFKAEEVELGGYTVQLVDCFLERPALIGYALLPEAFAQKPRQGST
jgi:hypothetical protein